MTVTTVNDLPGSLSVSARGVVCGNQGGAIQSSRSNRSAGANTAGFTIFTLLGRLTC